MPVVVIPPISRAVMDDVMGVGQQLVLTFELMSSAGIYFPRYPSCVLDGLEEER